MINIWKLKPTSILNYKGGDEYIISIDESGTSNLNLNEHNNFFTLTAVIVNVSNFENIRKEINCLKFKHWKKGMYKGKRVVLHGRDIRKKKPPFSNYQIDNSGFQKDLVKIISSLPISVIAIHIDKEAHVNRYAYPEDVYSLCTMYLMERISLPLNRANSTAVMMMEARGSKEDKHTLSKVLVLMDKGNRYIPSKVFNKISGVYFDKQRSKCGKKSFWQIEISDLISYNLHRHLIHGDNKEIFDIIQSKLVKTREQITGLKII